MKFGLFFNTAAHGTDPELLTGVAHHAEACGFESILMPEHIVLYPGAGNEAMRFPPDLAVADPLDCLAYVAATTTRLLLGTAVVLLPYHQPSVMAKRLATIDQLSKGRMSLFTIGVGTLPGEATAAGVDFTTRGRRTDEAIDMLRLLWSGDADGVSYQGEFHTLDQATSFPKPYQRGTLPIHVGGSSLAAARRAGRRGDGYFPGGRMSRDQRAEQLAVMRAEAEAAGRDPAALDHTRWGTIDMDADDVEALAAQGVTRLVVSPHGTDLAGMRIQISAMARRVDLG